MIDKRLSRQIVSLNINTVKPWPLRLIRQWHKCHCCLFCNVVAVVIATASVCNSVATAIEIVGKRLAVKPAAATGSLKLIGGKGAQMRRHPTGCIDCRSHTCADPSRQPQHVCQQCHWLTGCSNIAALWTALRPTERQRYPLPHHHQPTSILSIIFLALVTHQNKCCNLQHVQPRRTTLLRAVCDRRSHFLHSIYQLAIIN